MKVKINDKITWKDKYGRILPGIVTSIGKYDAMPDLDLNHTLNCWVNTIIVSGKLLENLVCQWFLHYKH
jgi:hypothetical protein